MKKLPPYNNKVKVNKVRQGMIAYESRQPDYTIGFETGDISPYAHIVDEDVDPSEVDLSSFRLKNHLNRKFWKNGVLDSRIRLKLLDIADEFIDSLNIDWVTPEDIIITGSLAHFTWNPQYSDIDLHIVMDFKKVDERTDFVKEYFDAKKREWNENHSGIKIFGYPVEVYVQDKSEVNNSNGVYSLEKNKWLKKPDRSSLNAKEVHQSRIRKRVATFMNAIDEVEAKSKTDDDYMLEKCYDRAQLIFKKIKNERKRGFEKSDSEMNDGNLIFKSLRRNGYIEKILSIMAKISDKLNSLP